MEKILVTGGAGFIGAHLCKHLIERGDKVVIVDNFDDYYDPKLKEDRINSLLGGLNFKLYRADIRNYPKMEEIFKTENIDKVVHLAGMAGVLYSIKNPFIYEEVNIRGTLNLMELSTKNKIKKFVSASSSSVYGTNDKYPYSESDKTDTQVSMYAATKKAGELIAHVYNHIHGLDISNLRFFTVYGPWGRPDMAYFKFTKNIIEGKPIDVYNYGKMKRDFTYVDDIVAGISVVLDKTTGLDTINIGCDKVETLDDFILTLEKHIGKKAKKIYLPVQPGDVLATSADVSKLRSYGWEPTTNIDDGLKEFVGWYNEYYGENKPVLLPSPKMITQEASLAA